MSEYILKESEISPSLIVDYFRKFNNREGFITIIDDKDNLMGYLTLNNASSYLAGSILTLSKSRPIGHQSNFHSYQIALSILPAYIDELKAYLESLGLQSIGIDANVSDYNYIKSYLSGFCLFRYEDYSKMSYDAVIILRCPKQFQSRLFGKTQIIKLSDLLESFLLADLLKFAQEKNIRTLFIEGPVTNKLQKKEIYKYLGSKISLEEILEDKDYIARFCLEDHNAINYIYDPMYGVLSGNRIVTNGICLRSANFTSAKLNVNQHGERKTLPNTKSQANTDIYIYGSCLSFGIFAEDEKTFPSYLQELINESDSVSGVVHNMGVKGKALLINDMLLAMQSNFKSQDILVFVSPISPNSISILNNNEVDYFDFTDFLNEDDNSDCYFLNNGYHSNIAVYKELAKFTYQLILQHAPTSSNKTKLSLLVSGFTHNGKKDLFDQHYLWKHIFLKQYLSSLSSFSFPVKGTIVGSVLITANPFTFGHVSLIERALKHCDYLYVFVVESDSFQYSFSQRMEMVKGYLVNNSRCQVVPSGDIWGSKDLFPEYFNRESTINNVIIPQEDAYIYCNYIAPTLGISLRFVGDEKNDPITQEYNQYLETYLPTYGIKVIRFERKKTMFGVEIEGKTIRKIIKEKGIEDESLNLYLPPTTIKVMKA